MSQRDPFIDDLDSVMQTQQGRNVLLRILEMCGTDQDTFHTNERVQLLDTGKRQVGIWLTNELISASSHRYLSMMKQKVEDMNNE